MLKKLVYSIVDAAFREPLNQTVVYGDIYRLNKLPHIKYGVVAIEPLGSTQGEYMMDWRFRLVYTDRLMSGQKNTLDVQNTGIDVLHNMMLTLENKDIDIESTNYQTYTQRFKDECAGAYLEVTLQAPRNYVCMPELGGDFSVDFNDDFLIYRPDWEAVATRTDVPGRSLYYGGFNPDQYDESFERNGLDNRTE